MKKILSSGALALAMLGFNATTAHAADTTPPVISFVFDHAIHVGDTYTYSPRVIDESAFKLTYSGLPTGFTANEDNTFSYENVITGEGAENNLGAHNITITATDAYGNKTTVTYKFTIVGRDVKLDPVIDFTAAAESGCRTAGEINAGVADLPAGDPAREEIFIGWEPCLLVGDYVWNDSNKNGLQDSGEKGIANTTVTITNNDTKVVINTKTDVNGKWLVALPAGDHLIKFSIPTNYKATAIQMGANKAIDSDAKADGTTPFTVNPITWDWSANGTIKLNGSQVIDTIDAGFFSVPAPQPLPKPKPKADPKPQPKPIYKPELIIPKKIDTGVLANPYEYEVVNEETQAPYTANTSKALHAGLFTSGLILSLGLLFLAWYKGEYFKKQDQE